MVINPHNHHRYRHGSSWHEAHNIPASELKEGPGKEYVSHAHHHKPGEKTAGVSDLARALAAVAEDAGDILGYAYAGAYRPRRAYRYTVENSVYVAAHAHRRGVGRALLAELIRRCTEAGFRQMIAVIGDSDNQGSIGLHRKMGFREVGTVENVGFKFGRWLDSVTMQLALGDGGETLPPE